MLAELWIGEMLMKCNDIENGKKYLTAGLNKTTIIYSKDSMGQELIAQCVNELLE
jgi:hypothetical protein